MEIKDLAGLSKPLEKLVEVVAQGVGSLSKPYLIRKNAQAKAEEIRLLADAERYRIRQLSEGIDDARKLLGNADLNTDNLVLTTPAAQSQLSLPERIEERKKYQEAKEQRNIEDITSIAAEELANEEAVSNEPLEDDWIARFFDAARLISDEEMQELWGRILAGEIKQPNSYSLRTLELLRNISKKEAELFTKVAKLAIQCNIGAFVINPENGKYIEDNFGILFRDWLKLSELGLISSQEIAHIHKKLDVDSQIPYVCGDILIVAQKPAEDPAYQFPIKLFTAIGSELVNLVNKEITEEYLRKFAGMLKQNNAKVYFAKIANISSDGRITHTDLQEFDLSPKD